MAEATPVSNLSAEIQSAAEEYDKVVSTTRRRVDEDGVVYEWDAERRGWFPKVRTRTKHLYTSR